MIRADLVFLVWLWGKFKTLRNHSMQEQRVSGMIIGKLFARRVGLLSVLLMAIFWFPSNANAQSRVDGCQCTDFVYGVRLDIPTGMGDARNWLSSARLHRFPYDRIPQVGDVVVILNGAFGFNATYGHVAIVIDVSENRDRFSLAGWNGVINNCEVEIVRDLPVTYNTYFIHPKQTYVPYPIALEEWPTVTREQLENREKTNLTCYLGGHIALPTVVCLKLGWSPQYLEIDIESVENNLNEGQNQGFDKLL